MKIFKQTVSISLWETLSELMELPELQPFRLVGGTSLSLLLGHRVSVDIDLFTDAAYDSIDFEGIERILLEKFPYVDLGFRAGVGLGQSYYVGKSEADLVKLDLFYTDQFIRPVITFENIRMSQCEDIIAMKLEVVAQGGRKKDFWDLHELANDFNLDQMLALYRERQPFGFSDAVILEKLVDFGRADEDFDPICLKQKYWELIKLDFEVLIRDFKKTKD